LVFCPTAELKEALERYGAIYFKPFGDFGYWAKSLEAHVKTCPECNGDGVLEKGTDDEQQCPTCGGSGFVPDDDDDEDEVTRTAS
jgi:rubrerythrin